LMIFTGHTRWLSKLKSMTTTTLLSLCRSISGRTFLARSLEKCCRIVEHSRSQNSQTTSVLSMEIKRLSIIGLTKASFLNIIWCIPTLSSEYQASHQAWALK
jgi:hypothetical protein